jgi:hypothetical protein
MEKKKPNKFSIDFEDDNDDFGKFYDDFVVNSNREKNLLVSEINTIGNTLVDDIEWRRNEKNKKKLKYVKYIISKTNRYKENDLILYELDYIIELYRKTKNENSWLAKIINMLTNTNN